jgi:hypothetical protein
VSWYVMKPEKVLSGKKGYSGNRDSVSSIAWSGEEPIKELGSRSVEESVGSVWFD